MKHEFIFQSISDPREIILNAEPVLAIEMLSVSQFILYKLQSVLLCIKLDDHFIVQTHHNEDYAYCVQVFFSF